MKSPYFGLCLRRECNWNYQSNSICFTLEEYIETKSLHKIDSNGSRYFKNLLKNISNTFSSSNKEKFLHSVHADIFERYIENFQFWKTCAGPNKISKLQYLWTWLQRVVTDNVLRDFRLGITWSLWEFQKVGCWGRVKSASWPFATLCVPTGSN